MSRRSAHDAKPRLLLEDVMLHTIWVLAAVALAGWLATGASFAADALKLAIGQREIWHGAVASLGQRAGTFLRHGIELEILYTEGAGQTMQAVISGRGAIRVAAGTPRGMGAHAK